MRHLEKREPISIVETILIGIALSADAMSVTLGNLAANPRISRGNALLMPLFFGFFQGLMPTLGYFTGSLAGSFIEHYAGLVAFAILGVVGGKMVWDGLHPDGEDPAAAQHLGVASIAMQAVATSIDAFAVGVAFAATGGGLFARAGVIALCTFMLCLCMVVVGRKLGETFGAKAEIAGGIVLILIGLRALLG